MPSSTTPGSSNIHKFQSRDVDVAFASGQRLGTPSDPAIRFTRGKHFEASWFTHLLRPVSSLAPRTDLTGHPANGDFYIQAFNRLVTLPIAEYDYGIDWT